ncbi:MAG: hypothetical protein ACE5JK_05555, partial [Candidatus Omnitrophota bacterium]
LAIPANDEKQKGFLIRLWERVSARFQKEAPPVEVKPPVKVEPLVPVKVEPPVKVEEEIEVPEKPAPPKKPALPKKKRIITISKEKMIEIIERRLKVYPQIIDIIPALSRAETAKGEAGYYYVSSEGARIKLEDLDKKKLYNLFVRINHEATRIHTERLLRQIRQQEQLMRSIQSIPRPPQQPVSPPSPPPEPPRVYTPPKTPQPQPSVPERR